MLVSSQKTTYTSIEKSLSWFKKYPFNWKYVPYVLFNTEFRKQYKEKV